MTIYLLTIFSAVLLPLGLPNPIFSFGHPLIGIFSLVPLYIALRKCNSYRSASFSGILFGAVSTVLGSFWLAFFRDFAFWTIGGAVAGYMIYNALLFPFLYRSLKSRLPFRAIWFTMIWTAYELLKSTGFLAYPWGLAAYSWNEVMPMIQLASITGVYGISFLLVLANSSIAEWIMRVKASEQRQLHELTAFLAVVFSAAILFGTFRMALIPEPDTKLDMLLVQNNGDSWEPGAFLDELTDLQNLTIQGLQLRETDPDLIVWSETVLRYAIPESLNFYTRNPQSYPFTNFMADLPSDLLTGAPFAIDASRGDFVNAAILLDRNAVVQQVYGKQQLVPFAETIPFFEYPAVRDFFINVIGLRSMWLSGKENRLFEISDPEGRLLNYATPICFEDAFSSITRSMARDGADFFINITNNSWSQTDSAQTQHLAAARFRSIETGRTLVRSTNSGYTSIVDPWGRVTDSLPMFEQAVMRSDVALYLPQRETVFMLTGELFAILCLVISIAALFGVRKKPSGLYQL
ncbi:apolipoprotein N-acyltransferase [Spirochaeta dissipatitropha]